MRYLIALGLLVGLMTLAGCHDCHPVEGCKDHNHQQKQPNQQVSPLQNR